MKANFSTLADTVAAISRNTKPATNPAKTFAGDLDGQFDHEGVSYSRRGRFIQIGADLFRCDSPATAGFLFGKLTVVAF